MRTYFQQSGIINNKYHKRMFVQTANSLNHHADVLIEFDTQVRDYSVQRKCSFNAFIINVVFFFNSHSNL
jgi:hypothetical protein